MIRKSAIKTLYSPLFQLSRYNRTSFSQSRSFHLPERSYSTSSESEKLLDIFNRLREFHRANVRPDQHGKVSFEEAENQALMEWKWLRQSINQRGKTKQEEFGILQELVERLSRHEPLAYVLGDQPFGPLTILCKPPTLIPRSETEFLTENIFERIQSQLLNQTNEPNSIRRPFRILDICTGSGCIALLLRHRIMEFTDSIKNVRNATDQTLFEIVGVDNSDVALEHAKENLKHYNDSADHQSLISRTNQNVSIGFECTDLLNDDSIRDLVNNYGPFDVIVCNPPYIPAKEWTALDKSVKEFEDRNALVGHMQNDADGLYYYRRLAQLIQSGILSTSVDSIASDLPLLAVEVGHDQAKRVKEIFEREGGTMKTEIWKDPYDVERAVLCQIPKM